MQFPVTTRVRLIGLLAVSTLVVGCDRQSAQSPASSPPAATWNEQALAVSQGKQEQIVVEDAAITDRQLAELSQLDSLHILKVQQGVITDDGLKALATLPHLEQLVLRESPITNEGAKTLATFPALKILNLPQSQIDGSGLESLTEIPHLELLRIGTSRPIDADSLRKLKDAKHLRFLHFIGIPLSDDALTPLGEIETLESLYIDGASFSDEALSSLLKKRPGLHLHLDQKHHDSDPKSADHHH